MGLARHFGGPPSMGPARNNRGQARLGKPADSRLLTGTIMWHAASACGCFCASLEGRAPTFHCACGGLNVMACPGLLPHHLPFGEVLPCH
jgi:hypothetical protein